MRYCKMLLILSFALLAGCATGKVQPAAPEEFVEIANPAYTMTPDAPETIWVPRRYVERGIPRGGELVKKGYEAATRGGGEKASLTSGPGDALSYTRYYRVISVEKERVCFNAGRGAGIRPGQKLPLHRGGTVVEGIGFVPGEPVGSLTAAESGDSAAACGALEPGGQVRINDLVRVE